MASESPLRIGYAGSLIYHDPKHPVFRNRGVLDWVWTYHHLYNDPSTRSGYFMFKAIQKLKNKYGITASQFQLELWGNIHPRNMKQVVEMGIDDLVNISGYLPKERSLERSSAADILFLPLESGTNERKPLFIPGKLFEYLHQGKPILAIGTPSDSIDILKRSGLGLIFDPNDVEKIAEALHEIIKDRKIISGLVPDREFIREFSFQKLTGKLAGVFDELLNN